MEIVKLIGADVLPDDQKLVIEIARVIRVGFLQQNAFHAEDTYVPLEKQKRMMEAILYLYDACRKIVEASIPLSTVMSYGLFDKLVKMKYDIPNNALSMFDEYKAEIDKETERLMDLVGLDRRLRLSYPHEMDGGRRQRVGIARALALNPKFIVCDEPVSALDVSIQAQILNLLMDLQDELGITYMFITHNMSVVRHISHNICVMYLGQLVETSPTKELFSKPLHPYTKALLSAIPSTDIHHKKERIILKGELVSPIDPKPGCRFATRCPYACEACSQPQELREVLPGHYVSCCRVEELENL